MRVCILRAIIFTFIFHIVKSSNPYQYMPYTTLGQNLYPNTFQQSFQPQAHLQNRQNGGGEGSISYTSPNIVKYNAGIQAQPQPVNSINYQSNQRAEGESGDHGHEEHSEHHSPEGYGYGGYGHTTHHEVKPYGHVAEPPMKLGKGEIIKILLTIFPFLIPIIFVPLLLIVIGALLIPFIRIIYFRADDDGRNFPNSTFINEMTSKVIDSILFIANKYA